MAENPSIGCWAVTSWWSDPLCRWFVCWIEFRCVNKVKNVIPLCLTNGAFCFGSHFTFRCSLFAAKLIRSLWPGWCWCFHLCLYIVHVLGHVFLAVSVPKLLFIPGLIPVPGCQAFESLCSRLRLVFVSFVWFISFANHLWNLIVQRFLFVPGQPMNRHDSIVSFDDGP